MKVMYSFPTFKYFRGVCAILPDAERVERERVMMVVKHAVRDEYLIVKYASNGEISFPAGGIEKGDTHQDTIRKELQEETGIRQIDTWKEMQDRYFEVKFYSPKRQKNYRNKTHVYLVYTSQEIDHDLLSDEEKSIQLPYRWTLEQIQQEIVSGWDETNYEAMEWLVSKIESVENMI